MVNRFIKNGYGNGQFASLSLSGLEGDDISSLRNKGTCACQSSFEDDIDTLELNDALWGGGLTANQVVTTCATQTSPGIVDFNFGGGDTLRVIQGSGITTTDLFDDISIV